MKESFGILPSGEAASLYTISGGGITAAVTDYGANLVKVLVPDAKGILADVVLGYDNCNGYCTANGGALGHCGPQCQPHSPSYLPPGG